jgi:hypothetical protein
MSISFLVTTSFLDGRSLAIGRAMTMVLVPPGYVETSLLSVTALQLRQFPMIDL